LEEAVDAQVQINESLKSLLKEKYEEIENHKKKLIEFVASEPLVQESDKFVGEPSRINFRDLVLYLSDRLGYLSSRGSELEGAVEKDSKYQEERRRNLGFLVERRDKAEKNCKQSLELIAQRNRLLETFKVQQITLKSLQDRVDMMETSHTDTVDMPLDVLDTDEFIGDRLTRTLFPCLL